MSGWRKFEREAVYSQEKEAAGEGGLQQVASYRAGVKTEGLALQELRKR